MLKDLYEEALSLFPDKQDQEDIKREHERWPHYFVANNDELWFSKYDHFVYSDEEFLRKVLNQASESWKWNPDVVGGAKRSCIDRIRYTRGDFKYFRAYSLTSLLEECLSERRYDTYPYKLDCKPYQQQVFIDFLKKHKIHDFETMDECRKRIENNEPLT